ncbi:MAG: hypothetical protein LAN37_15785 [Acidobacteriia bacterium]|nr:hypothetical protein [Terriglobia bacterium]
MYEEKYEKPAAPGASSAVVLNRGGSAAKVAITIFALLYVMGSGALLLDQRSRLGEMEQKQAETQQKIDQRIVDLESKMKSSADMLSSEMDATQKQLSEKAVALQKSQRVAVKKMNHTQEQISAVASEVSGVKSDVDVTKSDVAATKTDLEATKTKLDKTIGDLGVQSGLIAHTRDELDVLKHKGDRNYFEFTLLRGKSPTHVSNVGLQLKKADPKRSRFTLNVLADDRSIEKKDRNVAEPLQFYSGKDHLLYEIVVFTVTKGEVTGYLSTPKETTLAEAQSRSR